MIYFLAYYGVWLAVACLVGALTGLACRSSGEAENTDLLRRGDFLLALLFCLFVSIAQATLGRAALYLESAPFLLAAFLAGVGAATLWVGRISRDRSAWRVGAGALALVFLAANALAPRELEADLGHGLGSLVAQAGGDPLNFEVSGRDVYVPADARGRRALAERLERAPGVRAVWSVDALSPAATELRERARAAEAARLAAFRAAEAEWARRAAATPRPLVPAKEPPQRAAERKSRDKTSEGRSIDAPAPPPFQPPPPLAWSAPRDPTLPGFAPAPAAEAAAETAEASSCRAALAALASSQAIRFAVASASVDGAAEGFLAKLARAVKQCPDATLEIRGHTDAQGSTEKNHELSLRRARSVADYLGRIGIARARLQSLGFGDERPIAVGNTPEGRAENRRVEIWVN
jgi:outer membrane protein OmpA-like peptidoglycan-associated protein